MHYHNAESTEKQTDDGAGTALQGSSLQEPDYQVEVKLSDLQADPNNPLFSVKSFEDLGLLVIYQSEIQTHV
jgi:ATP-dependent RNA helicase DDX19/DBP5